MLHRGDLASSSLSCGQKLVSLTMSRDVWTMVEHTAAELFDAATQDRYTTCVTIRVGVNRRPKRPHR